MATSQMPLSDPQPAPADHPAETVTAILEAARDVMAEGGLKALSMRTVAERVGLSATALYHHFKGKDDLVSRVVDIGYRRFGEYLQKAIAGQPKGSVERLLAMGEGYVRFAFDNREYFRVLYSIQGRNPRELDDLPGGGGYHLLRQCVVDAIESGAIRASDPDLIAHYLWTCVHGMVTLALACNIEACDCAGEHGSGSAVELFRSFHDFIRYGLSGPAAAGGPNGVKDKTA